MAHLVPLLERLQADESLPALARELFVIQAKEYAQLQEEIAEIEAKLMAWHRADECSWRLAKIPGIGPIGAVLLTMKTPQPELFRSGRQFAAWIGGGRPHMLRTCPSGCGPRMGRLGGELTFAKSVLNGYVAPIAELHFAAPARNSDDMILVIRLRIRDSSTPAKRTVRLHDAKRDLHGKQIHQRHL